MKTAPKSFKFRGHNFATITSRLETEPEKFPVARCEELIETRLHWIRSEGGPATPEILQLEIEALRAHIQTISKG